MTFFILWAIIFLAFFAYRVNKQYKKEVKINDFIKRIEVRKYNETQRAGEYIKNKG